jgi:hypothetical protein
LLPIISASVSWLILGSTGSPSLPKWLTGAAPAQGVFSLELSSSLEPYEGRLDHRSGRGGAERLAGQASFPEEIAGSNHPYDGRLPTW